MHNRTHRLVAILAVLAGPVRADLTTLPLETLLSTEVVSASGFPQQVRDAPSAVTVIDAEEIHAHGWRTLAEALASVRGTVLANDRAYTYLGQRGFMRPGDYNNNILLLVDGARINDNIYQAAYLGQEFPVDMAMVKRIEVVPGPGAAVYGNSAFLGVVNVVTKTGADLDGGELEADLGTQGTRGGRLSLGGVGGDGDWLISTSGWRRDGDDLYFPELAAPWNNGGWARNLDGEEVARAMTRLTRGGLTLSAFWSKREKSNPTAPFDSLVGDPRSQVEDDHLHLVAGYEHRLAPGLALDLLADYGEYRFRNDSPGDRTWLGDTDLYRDTGDGRWLDLKAHLTDTRFEGHDLLYGLEWQQDLENLQRGVNRSTGDPYAQISPSYDHWGLFVQDAWRLSPGWLLNLGGRWDRYGDYGDTFNPRLGLIQQIGPRTTLKYLAGTAYRAPTAYELAYDDAASGTQTMKGNPDLKPEGIATFELVADYQTESRWLLTGTAFHYRIRDLIEQMVDPADGLAVYTNRDRVQVSGVGAQAERRWESGAHLRASLNWQQAQDEAGHEVSHSPRLIGKLTGSLPLGRWRIAFEEYYTGSRLTGKGNRVADYGLVNLNLIAPPLFGAELSLRVRNLFDQPYDDPAGPQHEQSRIPQDGRGVEIRARWSFQ